MGVCSRNRNASLTGSATPESDFEFELPSKNWMGQQVGQLKTEIFAAGIGIHRWAWAGAWATGDSRRNVWCGAVRYGMSNVYLPVIKFENDLNFTSEYSKLVLTLSFAASLRLVSLFFFVFCCQLPTRNPSSWAPFPSFRCSTHGHIHGSNPADWRFVFYLQLIDARLPSNSQQQPHKMAKIKRNNKLVE